MSDTQVLVTSKSAWLSKINWVQGVGIAAMILAFFGINVPDDVKAQIIASIGGIQAVVTWVLRTFFTKTITHTSAG